MAPRIVLAEDNMADAQLLREILEERGLPHILDVISDGEEALRLVGSAGAHGHPCPDLLVLDLHLPKIDGPEVLRRFRANKHCQQIPVIVLSSFVSPKDRATVESFAGVSYFSKPSNLQEAAQIGQFIESILNL